MEETSCSKATEKHKRIFHYLNVKSYINQMGLLHQFSPDGRIDIAAFLSNQASGDPIRREIVERNLQKEISPTKYIISWRESNENMMQLRSIFERIYRIANVYSSWNSVAFEDAYSIYYLENRT